MHRFLFLFCMLLYIAGYSKDPGDTLLHRNSVRVEVAGKSIKSFRLVFERNLLKKFPEKHPNAFTSVEAGLGCPAGYWQYFIPGVGINRNWSVPEKNKIVLNAGIYCAAAIAIYPTSKQIRNSYKYGLIIPQEIINPVEPWLFLDVGIKYCFDKCFIEANFTPYCYYDRIYKHRFYASPWAGISFGFKI
ncbi:hypothetical protein BH11BAC7_BH11BAC7_23210 [soil metagenome]